MKTLTLVRHAKSSWKDQYLSDRERPLNKRGERDAPVMGKRIAEAGIRYLYEINDGKRKIVRKST